MYSMGTREDIIDAARELFWAKGYEATSPKDIQVRSKAGQGSFYHHFASKKELALTAINATVDEAIATVESVFQANEPIRQRLHRYLKLDRNSLRGCKVGRMVWDSAVEDDDLRAPMDRYFVYLERRIQTELDKSVATGEIKLLAPSSHITLMILTGLLGSYTLSRAEQTSRTEETVEALMAYLALVLVDKSD